MTSANIVGYTATTLAQGYKISGACFSPVAAVKSFNIQELVPVDSNGEVVYGGVFQMQTKDAGGATDMVYLYLNGEDDIGDDTYPNGWYEQDWDTFATKEFVPGEGFLFSLSIVGGKLTLKGMSL